MKSQSKETGIIHKGFVRETLKSVINKFQFQTLNYYHGKDVVELLKELYELDFTMRPNEYFNVLSFANAMRDKKGDFAEVGVYCGATAKLICKVKGEDKSLFLFDTFEGLKKLAIEDTQFSEGDYSWDIKKVRDLLKDYRNVYIHKGYFPEDTAHYIEDKKFSFVHLDVDIYKSTLDSLEFFYPRMVRGGVILTHDYARTEGVKKAVNQFLLNKREKVFELSDSQAFIIKE